MILRFSRYAAVLCTASFHISEEGWGGGGGGLREGEGWGGGGRGARAAGGAIRSFICYCVPG